MRAAIGTRDRPAVALSASPRTPREWTQPANGAALEEGGAAGPIFTRGKGW